MKDITKRTMRIAFFSAAAISVVLLIMRKTGFAAGLMTSVVWSVINISLAIHLSTALTKAGATARPYLILCIKFAALYLAGFLIVRYNLFPPVSILAGIALALCAAGIAMVRRKHKESS